MLVEIDLASGSRHVSELIQNDQFGANYLFNRVDFAEDVGAHGGFDEVAERMGISHLRYPGGTITEQQFRLTDPENDFQDVCLATGCALTNTRQLDLTPMSEFLAYADEAGAKVTIVLPTAQYAGDPARAQSEARAFVQDVLNGPYGHVVEGFELGNEWATFFGSASAYGQIANALAIGASQGALGSGFDPEIAIQPSARAARLNETKQIVDALSPQALAAIDAVVIHDYRPEPWTQQSISADKIDHVALFEAATGRALQTIATEWNIGNASPHDGLLQGAGILDLFQTHLRNGVDRAHIWPLLENTTTVLAGNVDENDPDAGADLMIGGELFRQMIQSLEGTQSLNFSAHRDLDGDGDADLLVYGYEAADRLVVFTASLEATAQDVTLSLDDLGDFDAGFQHLWVTEITVAEGEDPTSHKSFPVVTQLAEQVSSDVSLSLEPFQITRLEFAADCGATICETVALDTLRGTQAAEVFVLADDGQRDLVRDFDAALDRLDVSSFGAQSLADLTFTELIRKDGSISWLRISDSTGEAEAILRFDEGVHSANRLRDDNFIFSNGEAISPIPGMQSVVGTDAADTLRGSAAPEVFMLQNDDARDQIRDFEDGKDLIDMTAFETQVGELTIRNMTRKDGTVSWVEIIDADGQAEFILRFADGNNDAARLTQEDFLF